jgi:hypothetical protein
VWVAANWNRRKGAEDEGGEKKTTALLTNVVRIQLVASPSIRHLGLPPHIRIEESIGHHPDTPPADLLLLRLQHIRLLPNERLALDTGLELGHLDDGDADGVGEPVDVEDGIELERGRDVGFVVDVAEVPGGREGEDDGNSLGQEGEMDDCLLAKRGGF